MFTLLQENNSLKEEINVLKEKYNKECNDHESLKIKHTNMSIELLNTLVELKKMVDERKELENIVKNKKNIKIEPMTTKLIQIDCENDTMRKKVEEYLNKSTDILGPINNENNLENMLVDGPVDCDSLHGIKENKCIIM